ncbi:hypothetical protein [Streptomyces sp. NBC_01017]|uniref:hypothetical protein n=1 Tax=Streptomyces sp. NBC_01017 TaxID=2903721 RepID=UPI00386EF137
MPLNATGTSGALSVDQSTLGFGPTGINNQSTPRTLTVTNSGTDPLTVSSAKINGPGHPDDYRITDNTCTTPAPHPHLHPHPHPHPPSPRPPQRHPHPQHHRPEPHHPPQRHRHAARGGDLVGGGLGGDSHHGHGTVLRSSSAGHPARG